MRTRPLLTWQRVALAMLVLLAIAYHRDLADSLRYVWGATRGSSTWPPASIKVAVPWPRDGGDGIVQGVTLAIEELDAGGGPLAGKFQASYFDEHEDLNEAGTLARQIAADRNIMGVIGHRNSASALQSAVTYERHGILYLSPQATLTRLTNHRFQYTFRLVPNDDAVAAALVEYARTRGWKRVGVLYSRIEEYEALAQSFILRAHQTGLVISFSSSYLPAEAYRQNDFRLLLAATNDRPTDAILLADQLPLAGNMLLDMQELGMKLPVLSGDSLDSSVTWNIAGKSAERLRFAGFVDPESKEPAYAAFRERYRRRFGSPPGYSGAQGYAALMLLAQAVERSRSTVPIVVGTTIRTNTWDGIFGKVSFGNDGQIEGRKVIIKHIENGHIVPVKEVNP